MKEKDCFYDKLYKLLLQVGKSSSLLGGILSIIMFVLFFYLLCHLKFFSNDFLICLGLTLAMFISSLLCGLNFFCTHKGLKK
ncbi:hypothetical protein [Enterococcus faecium]